MIVGIGAAVLQQKPAAKVVGTNMTDPGLLGPNHVADMTAYLARLRGAGRVRGPRS